MTWFLIFLNGLVFVWEFSRTAGFSDDLATARMMLQYGATPGFVLEGLRTLDSEVLSTLLTSMFLHGGFTHIFFNMLFLFVFGDNIEDRFGHLRYLIGYLAFGIFASWAHIYTSVVTEGIDVCTQRLIFQTQTCTPAVGASGAISGVLGAYLLMFPSARIVTIVMWGYFIRLTRIPAILFLGFWFLLQLVQGLYGLGGNVAIFAHIGGFVAGAFVGALARAVMKTSPWSQY